ncbi:MAG: hypothetical protein D6706_02345 [Chloroflexi bacterium]|nr:MAG: hypothetical protein D6706_02345 [Chloroflexota bacterium]
MESPSVNNLITQLLRSLAPQVAPYELHMFHNQQEDYLRDPETVLRGQLGEDAQILTDYSAVQTVRFLVPIMTAVLREVVLYVMQITGEKAPCPEILAHLNGYQLEEIHKLVLSKARQFRLSEKKSHLLADTIVSYLAEFSIQNYLPGN